MNHIAERGFKAWLEAEGIAIPVHTGLTGEEIPQDGQVISCYIASSEHVVGPLYKLSVQIILATPPHLDTGDDASVSLNSHKTALSTLRGLVEDFDGDTSQLKTTFDTVTGDSLSGGFLEGEEEDIGDGKWMTTINLMVGVTRS